MSRRRWPATVLALSVAAAFVLLLSREFARPRPGDPPVLEFRDVSVESARPRPPDATSLSSRPAERGEDHPGTTTNILVRAQSDAGRPLPNRAVGVRMRGETGRTTGFTDDFGETELGVEIDTPLHRALLAGEAEAFVRVPGTEDRAAKVAPPLDGLAQATVVAPPGITAYLSIVDARGLRIRERSTLVSVTVGDAPPARYDVEWGGAFIGGLPRAVPIRVQAIFGDRPPRETVAVLAGDLESEVRVSLPAEPLSSALTARVTAPLRDGDLVRFAVSYGGSSAAESFVGFAPPTRDGRVRQPVPEGEDILVEVSLVGPGRDPLVPATGTLRLPLLKHGEEWDVGVVATAPEPLLAEGAVFTSDGRVAERAVVALVPEGARESAPSRAIVPAAVTDVAGHFEIRGVTSGKSSRVVAELSAENGTTPPVESLPARGLLITLEPSSRLSGSIAELPRLNLPEYMARPYVEARPKEGGPGAITEADADGRFSVQVVPGIYDVRIVVPGLVPLTIRNVAAPIGVDSPQSQLSEVRLTSGFGRARVRVTKEGLAGEKPARANGATVSAIFAEADLGRREPLVVGTDQSGEVTVPFELSGRPKALLIEYAEQRTEARRTFYFGYRPARVAVGDDVSVTLRPGARVEFAPDLRAAEIPPDVKLTLLVTWQAPTDGVQPEIGDHQKVWVQWRTGEEPVIGALPDGIWGLKLIVEQEGPARAFRTVDAGKVRVASADTLVTCPLSVAAALAGR